MNSVMLTAYGLRLTAAAAGFLLPWQTVWILRPGMLGGVPWPLATIGLYASDAVLLIAAVIGCLRRWRSDRQWLLIACALLGVLAAMNVWVSADPWLSAFGWLRLIALILALAGLPYSRETARAFLGGFLVAMLGHIALGFWQFATGHGFASTLLGTAAHDAFVRGDSVLETLDGRWLRAYGGFPHPNVFGAALLVGMLSLLVISIGVQRTGGLFAMPAGIANSLNVLFATHGHGETLGRSRISLRPKRSRIGREIFILALEMTMFVVFIFVLLLTFSRAAWIGLVVLLAVLAFRRATRDFAIAGAAFALVLAFVLAPLIAPRVSGNGRIERIAVDQRINALHDARTLSGRHVLFGVGLHAMPRALVERASRGPADAGPLDPYAAQPVHSVPLLAFVEIGAVGLALLFLAIALLFRHHSSLVPRPSSLVIVLLPPFLLDHHLWSLPIGLALVFILVLSASLLAQLENCTAPNFKIALRGADRSSRTSPRRVAASDTTPVLP